MLNRFSFSRLCARMLLAAALSLPMSLPAAVARSQDQQQIPVAIGIVDVQHIIAKSSAGQALRKQADQRRAQIQNDLIAKEKDLRAEQDQLNQQRATLSQEEFQQKAKALQEKLNAWRKDGEEKRKGFEVAYNNAMKQVFQTLQKAIGEIAIEKRLTLVLNKSVVIVSAQAWDITEAALAKLNKVLPSVKM